MTGKLKIYHKHRYRQIIVEETTSFLWAQRTCQKWGAPRHLGRGGVDRACVSGRPCWCPCQGRRADSHQESFCPSCFLLKCYSYQPHITTCMLFLPHWPNVWTPQKSFWPKHNFLHPQQISWQHFWPQTKIIPSNDFGWLQWTWEA